jgi:hypothetical protein
VLEKPSGWPSEGVWKGISDGLGVAWKGFLDHRNGIVAALFLLVLAGFLLKRFRAFPPSALAKSALRLGLGAMFSMLVAQYQFLPGFLVNGFTLWLAAFEIVVALGLIFTAWEKEFSALTGLLMVMFIIAIGQALARDLGIACGCFDIEGAGNAGETWFSLIRDVVLLGPVAWLVLTGRPRFLWQAGHS